MKPIISETRLFSYVQQVREIAGLAWEFREDVAGMFPGDFESFYYSVCRIPYIEDNGEEVNSRPKWILEKMPGADCKKKSTLIAAWCHLNRVPVRFVVMSNRPDQQPHHIYTEIHNGKKWIPADATYNYNKLGKRERETFRKVFQYE